MTAWQDRHVELANLMNPAFCGFLILEAVRSYEKEANSGMPFSLAFLVLPLVLHKPTRDIFPRRTTTTLLAWIQNNAQVRLDLVRHITSMSPFSRESFRFLMLRQLLDVGENGALRVGSGQLNNTRGLQNRIVAETEEVADCVDRARFLGRWLALSPDEATVYNFLGIRP
jgi:hypothetical protein